MTIIFSTSPFVSIVNPTRSEVEVPFEMTGAGITGQAQVLTITGENEKAYNAPGEEPQVKITRREISGITSKLKVVPISATIFKLRIRE